MEQNFCNKQPMQSVFRVRNTVKVLGHLRKMPSTVSWVRRTFVSITPRIPDCEKSLFALAQLRITFLQIRTGIIVLEGSVKTKSTRDRVLDRLDSARLFTQLFSDAH